MFVRWPCRLHRLSLFACVLAARGNCGRPPPRSDRPPAALAELVPRRVRLRWRGVLRYYIWSDWTTNGCMCISAGAASRPGHGSMLVFRFDCCPLAFRFRCCCRFCSPCFFPRLLRPAFGTLHSCSMLSWGGSRAAGETCLHVSTCELYDAEVAVAGALRRCLPACRRAGFCQLLLLGESGYCPKLVLAGRRGCCAPSPNLRLRSGDVTDGDSWGLMQIGRDLPRV
jgi:hypothetical protein